MPWWNRQAPVRVSGCGLGRRGSIAVEFALIAPVVLFLIAGIVDYGIAINARMSLSSAVRAGIQQAMQASADNARIEGAVLGALRGDVDGVRVVVSTVCECPDGESLDCGELCGEGRRRVFLQIEAARPFATLLDWPGIDIPPMILVTSRVRTE